MIIKNHTHFRRLQKTIILFPLVLLILLPRQTLAQENYFQNYSYKPDKAYFKSYWTVTKKIPTGPARWKSGEWIAFSGIMAGGAILYAYDDEIRKAIQRNATHGQDVTAEYVFEPWGSGLYPAFLLGGFYIYGAAAKDKKAKQVALGGVQVFIMTGITTQIIKHLTHRHRPYQNDPSNPRLWDGPFTGWDYTSFPSGHTSTAFALASLISSVYKDKIWVGIVSYTLATGVAWSRVYENKHWPSDVLIGAALGFAIGKTVYHVMEGKTNLTLGISDYGGVSLVYHLN
jgi:membrane-associated phospholipid phosphatase